jgi:hypothetical protein
MHKILMDQDGNIVKAHIAKGGSIPSGYTDIEAGLVIEEDTEGLSTDLLEAVKTEQVDFEPAVAEHWTDGEVTVYDANDIPTLVDENGDPYLDPAYAHVDAKAEVLFEAAFYTLKKKASADQSMRETTMDLVRTARASLLSEADIEINKLEDTSGDSSAWRTYRQALRDVTATYKKVDGDWKASVDSIDAETFAFPNKPE